MKNKILTLLILTMLSLPVSVQAEDDIVSYPQSTMQDEVVVPETVMDAPERPVLSPEDMDPNSFPHKPPVSKRKIAKKFLLAMFGVGLSSIIIFLGLSLYNKIRNRLTSGNAAVEDNVSLETPDSIQGAVRTFLDKTKW